MSTQNKITYEDLENTDFITVELIPERKGLILKHCEYFVSSRRHGTTVNRRYNDFVLIYDILTAKYPYRAISRLPPKRMVMGGGSPLFLQRRRAALERWLTLVARHPILAHDADLRMFLCETSLKLDKPKHDEFMLAGTQEYVAGDLSTEDMQSLFASDQEQLRVMQLGLGRVFKIFERVENRLECEMADIRELGAGLNALSACTDVDNNHRTQLRSAASLASEVSSPSEYQMSEDECFTKIVICLEALCGHRELCGRLSRGLHAERALAAAQAPHSTASQLLRDRHRYSLKCAMQEASTSRAYAIAALSTLPELFDRHGSSRSRLANIWGGLKAELNK